MTVALRDDVRTARELCRWFSRFRPRIASHPIFDFARLNRSAAFFCEVSPRSASEVSAIVRLAAARGVAIRTRGNGHALNGSSLPRDTELLVRTEKLADLAYGPEGTLSVGAGAILWSVDEWLRTKGSSLPVVNDGYAGPSVGGYAAAGGFGPGSHAAGAFWQTVRALSVVNGRGELRRIARDDTLFPWLFGSMGQLGIIVDAELEIRSGTAATPVVSAHRLAVAERQAPDRRASKEAGCLFWFTLFVREPELAAARCRLDALESEHPGALAFRNRYAYFIAHRGIVAPLVWPHAVPCFAVGSWGIVDDPSPAALEDVLTFDAAFTDLTLDYGYRRYVQSEMPSGPTLYERYFGPELYSTFRDLKKEQDPNDLFNRGWVFH